MPSTLSRSAPMSVISGQLANISGSAPATCATARRLRSPTTCTGNRFSMRVAFPITPTTGLRLIVLPFFPLPGTPINHASRRPINPLPTLIERRCPARMSGQPGIRLLFARKRLAGVDRIGTGQPGGVQRGRGGARLVEPGQLRPDAAGDGLAERAAEIDRPETVRHHLGGDAMQEETGPEACLKMIRRDGTHGRGIGRIG